MSARARTPWRQGREQVVTNHAEQERTTLRGPRNGAAARFPRRGRDPAARPAEGDRAVNAVMPGTSPPERTGRLPLRDAVDPVTRSRDFTRRMLSEWDWPPGIPQDTLPGRAPEAADPEERIEDVLLLVCELVSNACLHAGGPTELVLRCSGERLRIEVADRDERRPEPRKRDDPAQPGGYGLLIVEQLAQTWGSTRGPEGKRVWLEVRSEADSDASPARWDGFGEGR